MPTTRTHIHTHIRSCLHSRETSDIFEQLEELKPKSLQPQKTHILIGHRQIYHTH